jgi:acetyltransferase-like isoleucine patch superfamily enzyme
VDGSTSIGANVDVWHFAQIREEVTIGGGSIIGRGVYVGPGVRIGRNCKIQNYALLYEPTVLSDGVFVGPGAVLTNDRHPRAVNPDGSAKSASDWTAVGVSVGRGASIGARAVCVAPVTIGEWAMVAAGSVVTRDVPDFGLVAGAPARQIGWVGRAGEPLEPIEGQRWHCPRTGEHYGEIDGRLHLVDAVDG